MDLNLDFNFRNKIYSCSAFIDNSIYPCYVFFVFFNKDLIQEFGDEVTIKTDWEKVLPRKDDRSQLVELRKSLFESVKTTQDFLAAKGKMKSAGAIHQFL